MPSDFGYSDIGDFGISVVEKLMERLQPQIEEIRAKKLPAEVPAEVTIPSQVTQAGMFGGNAMLIALGLGFVALIGGIMFFTRKKKVTYAK